MAEKQFPVNGAQIALCGSVAFCAGFVISTPFLAVGDFVAAVIVGGLAAAYVIISKPPETW